MSTNGKLELQDVINAWNAQGGARWEDIGDDRRVEFALHYVSKWARAALDDLLVAVYRPTASGISVAHAIDHVKQVLPA